MKNKKVWWFLVISLCSTVLHPQQDRTDRSRHSTQFVTVDKDVKLEVLDWGGAGRPLVFLAGLGNDAHSYGNFAPRFTPNYHVYGITRRGFGASSKPAPSAENYNANRLGDDVLAVIDALKLDRPVLVGHSIAGEELSSIGSRHPEKVAGLIYLDAADAYGFYDQAHGDMMLDMVVLGRQIDEVRAGAVLSPQFMQDMLANVTQFQSSLTALTRRVAGMPGPPPPPPPPISLAIRFGEQKYTEIHAPALAIFACPHNFDALFRNDPAGKVAMIANDLSSCSAQADAFAAGVPSAEVVRLPNADHYIFVSNEADVIRVMNDFLAKLP